MKFINERFKNLPSQAPAFYKHIESYGPMIRKKIDVCNWEPEHNQHSFDALGTLERVIERKNSLLDSLKEN